ncbi:hypothetical protein H0H92_005910 [Tricholoma furcatifolium]|nr:hypothetical protein H0H92_005910 [Tricholoma furcatifolium]
MSATVDSLAEITRFPPATPFDAMSPLHNDLSTPFLTPDSLSPSSSTDSPAGQGVDQAFTDFMSCLSSPATDLIEGLQQSSYDQLSLEGLMAAAHTPPAPTTPPPTHQLPVSRHRSFPRRTILPYTTGNRRKKLKEKPIYTRRQVDDMLSAVSGCFAGTMEEVLKRVDTSAKISDKAQAPDPANQELRKILNDTLPRLFSGLQNFLNERTKAE